MANLTAFSTINMSALTFPTLVDSNFNGLNAFVINATTIEWAEGVPEQGFKYTSNG